MPSQGAIANMNRPPILRLALDGLIVDSFAGGGGASLGIEMALGRSPDIAINHDADALRMHRTNHPDALHLCEDVWAVDPAQVCGGRPVALMWLSPDCKHFSKAKGGKPVEKKIRGLAWVAIRWAKTVKPRVICLENVEEFADWGPVLDDGSPCPLRKGLTFRRFVKQLSNCGYVVDWQELVAADYGAPTTRKRLFLIARSDGRDIVWPEPSHPKRVWIPAAACIQWDLPCPSIFERERPLAENTLRRVARGIDRFVLRDPKPYIVPGFITEHANASNQRNMALDEPLRTQCAQVKGGHFALVAPTLIQTGYGERPGQAPRVPGLEKPLGTVVDGQKHALVAAFLAKHYGGHEATGSRLQASMDTITAQDHHALVASSLIKFKGTGTGQPMREPLHTVQAGGMHYGEVRAFLMKYHGTGGQWNSLADPMPTVVANDSIGLVTVAGERYAIADIGMRMLQPRELFRAQGFPDSYRIDADAEGMPFTKTAQVRMCGNSVCPPVAAAIVAAQFRDQAEAVAAA